MSEREQARAAARRLAIIRHAQEVTGNVARTCRYYGVSRQLYYTWLRRYEEHGIEGLRPRSRRPHTSPNATSGEVIGKISIAPGKGARLTVTLAAGPYVILCNVAAHYQTGQHTAFRVT